MLYTVQIIFQRKKKIIIGHENCNVRVERFYCLMHSSEKKKLSIRVT